ncbi:MAG: VWA domain-containing protein [Gammaproteobacteria bacterium]|nr:VWA domain-containing protein [Gammaproteobacteria bacterium]
MARKRRQAEVFSLSFLDVICCGFGAVVLFYSVLSAQSGVERLRRTEDLTAQVNRLEEQVLEGTRNLVVLRNTLEKTETDTTRAAARTTRVVEELAQRREQSSVYDQASLARRERIEKLKADIKALEESTRRLEAGSVDRAPPGERIRSFRGTGDRRYVTGLKMQGRRILILLDRSASMMDEDIVRVIVLRNSKEELRRAAPKWRRAIDTADWLLTQLPAGSQFQIYAFNTAAEPLVAGAAGGWLQAGDAPAISGAVDALHRATPEGGTSLINAFAAIRRLSPAPDQVVLITDHLPTQGASAPAVRRHVDARGRERLFDEAIRTLPEGLRLDVVLLPMKGDYPAAWRFWQLAIARGGAYLMPSRDWP